LETDRLNAGIDKLKEGIESRITLKQLAGAVGGLSVVLAVVFGLTKENVHTQVMAAINDDVVNKTREIATNAVAATMNAETHAEAIVSKLQDISTARTLVGHFSIRSTAFAFYPVGQLFFSTNFIPFASRDGFLSFDEVPTVQVALSGWNYNNPIRHIYADTTKTNGFNLIVAIEDVLSNRSNFGDLHIQWTAVGKIKMNAAELTH
jgi:hypothetical protein